MVDTPFPVALFRRSVLKQRKLRELLEATPDMPATVLPERVGWTGVDPLV